MSADARNAVDPQLSIVWAILEARRSLPAMVVVASATEFDGSRAVARGLAAVAYGSGRRTAYLDLGIGSEQVAVPNYVTVLAPPDHSEGGDFSAAVTAWRSSFDVVIVNVPALLSTRYGAQLARIADAVVIAVCEGRRITTIDRDLSAVFGELSAKVLGIVRTSGQTDRQAATLPMSQRESLRGLGRIFRALNSRG